MKTFFARAFWFFLGAAAALAEVTRIEVTSRVEVGNTGYEKVVGTAHFAVDPKHPRNRGIADIDKAPVAADGRVTFSADLYILKPKDARTGNGAALLEVVNRGGRGLITGFNRGEVADPVTEADVGDGFLMKQGFTLVSVGWEFDVPKSDRLLRIEVPVATDAGKPISGVVSATFVTDAAAQSHEVTDLAAYAPSDPTGPDSKLTVRASAALPAGQEIPRAQWKLNGQTVSLEGGFQPGKTYELFYCSTNPPIAGLGFAAFRDVAAWLRQPTNDLPPVKFVYAFGASQSGRFLRSFLYEGFNTDEKDRPVLDAVMAHIAGVARIDLNRRWSLPRSLGTYSATSFPFSDAAQRDPLSGVSDGLLENARSTHRPKMIYTNTAVEYWGGGRAAAMEHVDATGTVDLVLPENVRSYFLTGAQHGPGRFPPVEATTGQQRANPLDYWWTLRALLVATHRWVKDGVAPPLSAYPKLRDGTLVKAGGVSFPTMQGVASPQYLTAGVRVLNPLIADGGRAGAPIPLLVPQVDDDGNELAGVRLPDVAVPLATYTGWNFRSAPIARGELLALIGSWIPFPATRAAKSAVGDPRRSVDERYASRAEYLAKFKYAADELVKKRYLLAEDVERLMQRGEAQWDLVTAPTETK